MQVPHSPGFHTGLSFLLATMLLMALVQGTPLSRAGEDGDGGDIPYLYEDVDVEARKLDDVIIVPAVDGETPPASAIEPVPVEDDPSTVPVNVAPRRKASETGPALARPVRGVWVQMLTSEMGSAEEIDALVHSLRALNVDDIFFETIDYGMANCKSDYLPSAHGVEPDRLDPLAMLVEAAHLPGKRPIRVHAVVNPLRAWTARHIMPIHENHVTQTHPEWLANDIYGNDRDPEGCAYLSPAVPEVRTYLMAVVTDLANRYEIDGVLFDGMRYPGFESKWGYNPAAVRQYQADTGSMDLEPAPDDPEWSAWRASRLTGLLGAMSRALHERRQDFAVTASVLASGDPPRVGDKEPPDYEKALQFWPVWAADGVVDWLVMNNFHRQQTEQTRYLDWLLFGRRHKGNCRMVVAVSGKINIDSGVMMQMRMALGRGLDGVLLHTYTNPSTNFESAPKFLAYLGKTLFSPDYRVPYYAQDLAEEKEPSTPWANIASPEPLTPEELPAPVRLAEDAEPEPEPWQKEPWPPEVAPDPASPRSETAPVTQSDLARALLGLAETTERYAGVGGWPEEEEAIPPDQVKSFEPIDLDVDWTSVTLTNGKAFVGERLGDDGTQTRFRRRNDGIVVSIPNNRIAAAAPLSARN